MSKAKKHEKYYLVVKFPGTSENKVMKLESKVALTPGWAKVKIIAAGEPDVKKVIPIQREVLDHFLDLINVAKANSGI